MEKYPALCNSFTTSLRQAGLAIEAGAPWLAGHKKSREPELAGLEVRPGWRRWFSEENDQKVKRAPTDGAKLLTLVKPEARPPPITEYIMPP